jgi:hypothetical protein
MQHTFCNARPVQGKPLLCALRCSTREIAWPGRVGQGQAGAWYRRGWVGRGTAWHGPAGQSRLSGGAVAIQPSPFLFSSKDSRPTINRRGAGDDFPRATPEQSPGKLPSAPSWAAMTLGNRLVLRPDRDRLQSRSHPQASLRNGMSLPGGTNMQSKHSVAPPLISAHLAMPQAPRAPDR